MSQPTPDPPPRFDAAAARERSVQTGHAALTSVATAFFSAAVLFVQPAWPVTIGVIALAGMSVAVSFFILKR